MSQPPSIPMVPPGIDPQLAMFLGAMKEAITKTATTSTTVDVTSLLAAVDVKVAAAVSGTSGQSISSGTTSTANFNINDTSTPPALTGLAAVASRSFAILTWDSPAYTNQAYVTIYRSSTNDFSTAAKVGTSRFNIFSDYTSTLGGNYYWIKSTNWGGIEGPINSGATAGTLATTTSIGDISETNGTIGADRILVNSLGALTANLGTVNAGELLSPDGSFWIDLVNKAITIAGAGGVGADDYMVIQNGTIDFHKWTGTTYQLGNALQTIEAGQAASGSVVTLGKWYSQIPDILVSPYDVVVYQAGHSTVDQALQVRAENASITTGGAVSFTAVARSVTAGGTTQTTVSQASGTLSTDAVYPVTPITQTTAANVTAITCNLTLQSYKGTGTAPNYKYRQASIRIAYRTSGSTGAYSFTTPVIYSFPADLLTHTTSVSATGLTAAAYEFYVEITPSDTGTKTFTNGSGGYNTSTASVSGSGGSSATASVGPNASMTSSLSVTFGSYVPPSGWTVYGVDYNISYTYDLTASTSFNSTASASVLNYNGTSVLKQVVDTTSNSSGLSSSGSGTYTYSTSGSSYVQNQVVARAVAFQASVGTGSARATVTAGSCSATIKIRQPVTNSPTPTNVFVWDNFISTIAAGGTIISGTLSYVAIG